MFIVAVSIWIAFCSAVVIDMINELYMDNIVTRLVFVKLIKDIGKHSFAPYSAMNNMTAMLCDENNNFNHSHSFSTSFLDKVPLIMQDTLQCFWSSMREQMNHCLH